MKKVFISGSRGFTYLPIDFKEAIEWLVELGSHEFLVGDCTGSVVWHRNCLGFPKPKVEDGGLVEYYALKDIRMSRDCDKALVLWDGSSRATKNNIDRLKGMGKKVVVFNYGSE